MKLRMLAGLACALALSGCATYDYVGGGGYDGGYYSGSPVTQYRYYDYGYPSYGYSPGVSLGLSYGYPAYGYPLYRGRYPVDGAAGYPYFHGVPYRPPAVRPGHHGRPEANRPPTHGRPGHDGPRDRAPWRDLERLRNGEQPRQQRPGPRTNMESGRGSGELRGRPGSGSPPPGNLGPRPGTGTVPSGRMPSPEFRPRPASGAASSGPTQTFRQRQATPAYTPPVSRPAAAAPAVRPVAAPAPRSEPAPRARPAASSTPSRSRPERPSRTETRRTLER